MTFVFRLKSKRFFKSTDSVMSNFPPVSPSAPVANTLDLRRMRKLRICYRGTINYRLRYKSNTTLADKEGERYIALMSATNVYLS